MSDSEEYQYINEGVKAIGGFEHPKLAECISCVFPGFSSEDTEDIKKRIFFHKEELTTELLKSRYLDNHKYGNMLITISISGDNNVEAVRWDLSDGRTDRRSTCNLSLLENGILQDVYTQNHYDHDAVDYTRKRFYSDDGSLLSKEQTYYDYSSEGRLSTETKMFSNYSSDGRLSSETKELYSSDGRLSSKETTSFNYSSDGRLLSERIELYSVDGRLSPKETTLYNYSSDGRVLSSIRTFHNYSSDGRLLSERSEYRSDGRLLSTENKVYVYSSDGKLLSVRKETYSDDGKLLSGSRNEQPNTILPTSALQFALNDLTSAEKSQVENNPKESELTKDGQ